MKSLYVMLFTLAALVLTPVLVNAQTDQATATRPPVSQPLVREGTFATSLADALRVGSAANEAEAESALSTVGIAPRNGWIGDYPVTPDIAGELQTAVGEAAEAGRLSVGKDEALKAYQDVIRGYGLAVKSDTSGQVSSETSAVEYPDTTTINNYYYNEGPPAVTYYAPPPDYAYLYSWVPYPFWWWDFWFPGFFVLLDFDIGIHGHHGHHGFEHGRFGHDGFVSNHFRDRATGRMSRIDPANRSHGGTLSDRGVGSRWSSASARRGATSIFNSRTSTMARSSGRFAASSGSARTANLSSSRGRWSGSPSGRRSAISGAPTGRTYGSSHFYGGSGFSQPSYRTSSRTFSQSHQWSSGRSFRSFTPSSSRGSFGGGSRGSFGGMSRGSFGGGGRR